LFGTTQTLEIFQTLVNIKIHYVITLPSNCHYVVSIQQNLDCVSFMLLLHQDHTPVSFLQPP